MKTIIKYILAVPLMLCFSSCLDEHPKDQLDQEAIYNNADNIYPKIRNYHPIHD